MRNYINTAATDITKARTVGLTQLTPEPFPVLVVGTQPTHDFFFADRGVIESFSGDASSTLRVTVGDAWSEPTGGTWGLTVTGESQLVFQWDADAAAIQFALNALATVVTNGGVDVTQQRPGQFLIAYRAAGAVAGITVDATLLDPDCIAELTVLAIGATGVRQLSTLNLRRAVPLQTTTFSRITSPSNGWEGVLSLDSAAMVELLRLNGQVVGNAIEWLTTLTVEVINASNQSTAFYQTPVIIRALNYGATTQTAPAPLNSFVSRHSQASTSGNVTVTPASQMHTEIILASGSAEARKVIVTGGGLIAGAHVWLRLTLPATNGLSFDIRDQTAGGTSLATVTCDSGGFTPTAMVELVWDGSNFQRQEELIPAFGQQT